MNNIAETLRTAREEAGIELSEVSNDLNISELSLKNIEEGKIGSFKDVFELKQNISSYVKYLGLDEEKLLEEFNEYLFDYTSKIPVKEIEKTIDELNKDNNEQKISSPYTISKIKSKKWPFIVLYILVFVLVSLAIYWSINQITVDRRSAYVISYKK